MSDFLQKLFLEKKFRIDSSRQERDRRKKLNELLRSMLSYFFDKRIQKNIIIDMHFRQFFGQINRNLLDPTSPFFALIAYKGVLRIILLFFVSLKTILMFPSTATFTVHPFSAFLIKISTDAIYDGKRVLFARNHSCDLNSFDVFLDSHLTRQKRVSGSYCSRKQILVQLTICLELKKRLKT